MGVYYLIQIPSFQNYAVKKATAFLSDELHAEVSVGRIRITFFQSLLLEDLLVKDRQNDTLLMTSQIKVGLKGGLFDLIDGKIDIQNVAIKTMKVRLIQNCPEYDNNYQFLINYIENGNPDSLFSKPSGKPNNIHLSIKDIDLKNVDVTMQNKYQGQLIHLSFESLIAGFNTFSIDSNQFYINELKLEGPIFNINDIAPIPCKEIKYINPYLALEAAIRAKRKPRPDLRVEASKISVEEAIFSLHDYKWPVEKELKGRILDFSNLDLNNINIGLENLIFNGKELETELTQLAVKTNTPFNINDFSAVKLKYTENKISLEDFNIDTDYSHLEDSLTLSYKSMDDFQDFVNKVKMSAQFKNSHVGVKDIMVFDKSIHREEFLTSNVDKDIQLSGRFSGTVNNLRGNNVLININDLAKLDGNFTLHDITEIDIATLNLNVNTLSTSAKGLEKIIPGFVASPELKKLGNIVYSGKFDGYILDFVTYGKLKTAQANGDLDMHLNIRNGTSNAAYSGKLNLDNFNLGAITGQTDIGKVSGSFTITDGKSFSLDKISSTLTSDIRMFSYKGYDYKNFKIDGKLNKNTFDGKLKINDPNIDLDFNGNINFSEQTKILKFDTDIRKFNPDKLNLSSLGLTFKGIIKSDLTFRTFNDIQGTLLARNFVLKDTSGQELKIDTLNFIASNIGNGAKKYNLNSDLIDAVLQGRFQIEKLPIDIVKVFHYNHTKLANQFNIQSSEDYIYDNNFDFSVNLKNSKNAFKLLGLPLDAMVDSKINGKFSNVDSTKYNLNINSSIPNIAGDGFKFKFLFFEGVGNQSSSDYFVYANSGNIGDLGLNQMDLSAALERDDIKFNIKTPKIQNIAENLSIDGNFTVDEGYNILKFNQSKFDFFDDGWTINKDNLVKFGNNELIIQNLEFTNGEQDVSFNSFGTQGLNVEVNNFSGTLLDSLLSDSDVQMRGTGNIYLKIDNVFSQEKIVLTSQFDSLSVNGISLGKLDLFASTPSLKSKIDLKMTLGTGEKELKIDGLYTLPDYKGKDYANNYLDLLIKANNYPLVIADIFLGEMINDTRGAFTTNIKVKGPINNLSVGGDINLQNMATTVKYLGTRYYVPKYTVGLSDKLIDLDDMTVLDERGNTAIISGGIKHNKLKNLYTNIELNSDNFLLLNTYEKDNSQYYGTAGGKVNGKFTGPFDQLNIEIDAVTGPNTELFLPIASSKEVDKLTFIQFRNIEDTTVQKEINKVVSSKGLSLKMNLDVNENATLNLIIDKQTGDVIKAKGNGVLDITIPRNGNLNMYGGFEVASGEYKLNIIPLYNLSIFGAPFLIKKGGTLIWNGDPVSAQVNIDAEYRGINTSPYNFIAEYLPGDPKLQNEASRPTPVDLTLNLRGELLKPEISFKIDFPQLSPDIKIYVDSKLRSLEQDPNELYKQAASLVSFGSFIPKDILNLNAVKATTYNTLSDLISSQLTQILSPMLNAAVADGKVLTGVSLNLNYNFYEANSAGDGGIQGRIGSELQIGPSLKFFNEKLILNTGVKRGDQGADPYVAGDVDLQYNLTADRRYVLRLYQKNDAVLEGRRIRSGAGFSYRRTVDSFGELFRREDKKKKTRNRN